MTLKRNISYQPRGKGVGQVLGQLQARVMESLWASGPTPLVEVHRALAKRSPIAYTTVSTELSRLVGLGLVKKTGSYLETRYAAALDRETFVERFVGDVVAGLLGSHGRAAIAGFVDAIAEDPKALAETMRLLGERRESG